MIRYIFKEVRPDTNIDWFVPDDQIKDLKNQYRESNQLLYENVTEWDDQLSTFYVSIWKNAESYSNFINEPMMISWRTEKLIYCSTNGIISEIVTVDEL